MALGEYGNHTRVGPEQELPAPGGAKGTNLKPRRGGKGKAAQAAAPVGGVQEMGEEGVDSLEQQLAALLEGGPSEVWLSCVPASSPVTYNIATSRWLRHVFSLVLLLLLESLLLLFFIIYYQYCCSRCYCC